MQWTEIHYRTRVSEWLFQITYRQLYSAIDNTCNLNKDTANVPKVAVVTDDDCSRSDEASDTSETVEGDVSDDEFIVLLALVDEVNGSVVTAVL